MALLFIDGFDHYGTTTALLTVKWASSAGSLALSAAAARTGAFGFQGGNIFAELISKPLAASGGVVVGLAMRANTTWSSEDLLQVREGTTVHLAVGTDGSGHLTVKRGTTVLATGATVLATASWYYLELKGVIHDTTGSYTLRINGVSELTASGIDTRNAGTTGQWDRIRILGQRDMDDLYVCDQSATAPNDLLGICKIETLLPQAGNGTNTGLTPSTGTDHGALVDEVPPNTTDYNASPTVGLKDTYHYPSLTLTGTILGIQTNLYVNKTDAVARQVCAVVRTGGTDYDGANVSPLTTFSYLSEPRALNPATGVAWTSADIAALEAGMKVTA